MKSSRQKERQKVRKNGRYAKMCACYKCGKAIRGEEFQQISDDQELMASAIAAGLPSVGVICHKCIALICK